jgi:hypothetical protein
MAEKTVGLSEVLGTPPDIEKLAACIRRGFEIEWGIAFDVRPMTHHITSAERLP